MWPSQQHGHHGVSTAATNLSAARVTPHMSSLYHEQQLASLCGVHALNNLLQGPAFGAGDLASIAHELDAAERVRSKDTPGRC